MRFVHLVIASTILSLVILPSQLFAQETGGGVQPTGHGISINTGPMLPNAFPVSDEILKSFSIRYDYPSSQSTFFEGGMLFSNSQGIRYQDLAVSFRADMPFQDLTVYGLAGLDLVRMKKVENSFTYYGTFHVAGGALAHIYDQAFLRMEMRFNLHPGTLMMFTFGLEYHFGAGGGGGG